MAVKIDHSKCVGCGICIETCPSDALYNYKGKTYVNEKCDDCGKCIDQCICAAITLSSVKC